MAGRSTVRWVLLSILFVLFAASVATMFGVRGRFDPPWFWGSLALLGVGMLVIWLASLGREQPRLEFEEEPMPKRVASAPSVPRVPDDIADAEPELVVQKTTGAALAAQQMGSAGTTAAPIAKPAGFKFRGFTLYERPGKTGPTRFFSKSSPPGGASPIALPEGHEPKWDKKKARPFLVALAPAAAEEPEPSPLAAEEPKFAPTPVLEKNCAAMIAPGEFCENVAKDGSQYCAKHAKYKGVDEFLEVRHDQAKASKAVRLSAPTFEVRVAKAVPSKPGKAAKPSTLVVQTAKPKVAPVKIKPIETELNIKTSRPVSKPVKLQKAGDLVVRMDVGQPVKSKGKALKPSELVVRQPTSQSKPVKPLKIQPSEFTLREPAKKPVKPIKVQPTEFTVREPQKKTLRPMRIEPAEFTVRTPEKTSAKPMKVEPTPFTVREPHKKAVKPLKIQESAFTVAPTKKSVKPIKVQESEIVVVRDTRARSDAGSAAARGRKR